MTRTEEQLASKVIAALVSEFREARVRRMLGLGKLPLTCRQALVAADALVRAYRASLS